MFIFSFISFFNLYVLFCVPFFSNQLRISLDNFAYNAAIVTNESIKKRHFNNVKVGISIYLSVYIYIYNISRIKFDKNKDRIKTYVSEFYVYDCLVN